AATIACARTVSVRGVMGAAMEAAASVGVPIGAHPGLPDPVGFGRRAMQVRPQEVYDLINYQVGALQGFAYAAGAELGHVKPHGALYNMAAAQPALADAIARAVRDIDRELVLYGLAGSHLLTAAG